METSELSFLSFAELAIMKIAYGELHGVFRKEDPAMIVLDVFLPDESAEFGRRWQGQIHVRGCNFFESLREFHKTRILVRYFEHLKELREYGATSRFPAPPKLEVDRYRAREHAAVVAEIEKTVINAKAEPYFGKSMVSYCLFNERPYHPDPSVAIHLVPAAKTLILTDINGRKKEVELDRINVQQICATSIEFLASQGIQMLVPKLAEAA